VTLFANFLVIRANVTLCAEKYDKEDQLPHACICLNNLRQKITLL